MAYAGDADTQANLKSTMSFSLWQAKRVNIAFNQRRENGGVAVRRTIGRVIEQRYQKVQIGRETR